MEQHMGLHVYSFAYKYQLIGLRWKIDKSDKRTSLPSTLAFNYYGKKLNRTGACTIKLFTAVIVVVL